MESFDHVIVGGTVADEAGVRAATIAIRGERIAAVLPEDEIPSAKSSTTARGLLVLPGLIDTHVHFRDPSVDAREDFISGTRAAAAAGVTTVLEMPISNPGVGTPEILEQRRNHLEQRAIVDFGLFAGAGVESEDLESMADAGAIGFKTFLHPPAPGRESEFLGLWCESYGELTDLMRRTATTGLVHAVHCEDESIIATCRDSLSLADRATPLAHARSRPRVAEDVAASAVLSIAADVGARAYLVHLSSPLAVELVRDARRRGQDAVAEVSPNHLFLTERELEQFGPLAKCNPPLRDKRSVERLWTLLREGSVDIVGSDHAPFTGSEKGAGDRDIFAAPPGIPGIELLLPLLLTAVHEGELSLPQLIRLTSARASTVFGLKEKGRLAPGAHADLVIVDPKAKWQFDSSNTHSRSGGNLQMFDGRRLTGRVISTLVRGAVVYREGEILVSPGHGCLVRPDRAERRGVNESGSQIAG